MTQPVDPDVTVAPITLPHPDSPSSPPAAPEGVPGYELLGELGRGGMGVVYKARHTTLNRVVALKMILAGGHAGEEALARFQTEAEAIARLQHPGIVQVYEVGRHGGLPWIALEFCEGGSLEKRLAGQPQPPASAAALVETLARAVQAAHEKGVVHRDLKPANVLMTRDGGPKVTDFGLAKKLDDASGATRTGSIMGTPSYMAPEQAEAKKDVGPPADIYALGAILYECLTGRPPFRAATPLDTILQVVADEPVPPSRLVARLPRDLETICLKCLQKDPTRRYASARALADDLAAFGDGRPITARPVGRLERAWRWARRNRAVAAAGLVTLLALVAASLVSATFGLRATASAELAREEAERAEKHAEEEARQRRQAQDLERANRRQVIDLTLSRGQQLLSADDPAGALPWLVEAARLDPGEPLHRRRLDRVLRGLPRPAHLWRLGGSINHMALSPDGKRVAAADNAGVVRAWDVETGEPVGPELKHPYPVLAIAFSPDGSRLATAGGVYLLKGEIRVYDPQRGGEPVEKVITGPAAFVLVGFSADGKFVFGADFTIPGGLLALTGGRGRNTFRAWERATAQLLEEVNSEFQTEPGILMTERLLHRGTGRLLVVENKQTRVVELGRKRTAAGPWPHASPPWFARLSPDGRWATRIGTDGAGKVYDLDSGREHALAVNYPYRPVDIGVYSNEQAAIAFYDGAVIRYQLSTGTPLRTSQERPGSPGWACAFSPDGGILSGQGQDDRLRLWQVPWWRPLSPWLPHGSAVTAGEVAAGGRLVVTGTADGVVRVWDLVRSEDAAWSLNDVPYRPADVPFDEKGRAVLVGRGKAMTIEPATGQVAAFTAAEDQPGQTARSPDGKLLAVGTPRGVRLIDTATGQDVRPPLQTGLPLILDLEFSPDGRWLAARASRAENPPTSWMGEARAWDVATGKELVHLRGASWLELGGVTALAVSPDGRRFAAGAARLNLLGRGGGFGGEVRLVEAATGKVERALAPSAQGMASPFVTFSPDGRRLAVIWLQVPSMAGEVAVWDVAEGKLVLPPIRPSGRLRDVAFRGDGRHVAVSAGNEVQVWDVEAGRLAFRLPHGDVVFAVRYTGGGKVLAAVTAGRDVYTWDARSGESLGPPAKHQNGVFTAGVSPDGRWLITVGQDRRMYAWFLGGEVDADTQGRLARLISGQAVQGTTAAPLPLDTLEADLRHLRQHMAPHLVSNDLSRRAWHIARLNQLHNVGAWGLAADQFEAVPAPQPAQATWWDYQQGTCRLGAGDLAGLRRCCERMLRRELTTTQQVENTVKLSLLRPDTLPDPKPVFELSRQLDKVDEKDPLYLWVLLARGLARYREGKLDEAAAPLRRLGAKSARHGSDLLGRTLLAMTLAKQGKPEEAKGLLAAVEKGFSQPERVNWIERLQLAAVLEEARREVGQR